MPCKVALLSSTKFSDIEQLISAINEFSSVHLVLTNGEGANRLAIQYLKTHDIPATRVRTLRQAMRAADVMQVIGTDGETTSVVLCK